MAVPKTLLLVDGPLEPENAGEIFLRTLCQHYPKDKLCRFALMRSIPEILPAEWMGFPLLFAQRIWEQPFGRIISRGVSFPINYYARSIYASRLAAQAIRFGRDQRVEQVWAVLDSPQIIYIAKKVAEALRVPLVVTVWDPPERFAIDLRMDPWSRNNLLRDFSAVIRAAHRLGLASDGMEEEYKKQYGIDSVVLIQGISHNFRHVPSNGLSDPERLIIGFAGSMYASQEWRALLSALTSVNWIIQGRHVTIRILGREITATSSTGVFIEYLGWRSFLETIDLIATTDIAYVPYWLDEAYKIGTRLCFPNKISSYMASGRPIFVHAPKDSSPVRFANRFGVGLCCHTYGEREVIDTLSRFVTDTTLYQQMAKATQNALDEELDLDIFLRRFAYLMGISENDLTSNSQVYS